MRFELTSATKGLQLLHDDLRLLLELGEDRGDGLRTREDVGCNAVTVRSQLNQLKNPSAKSGGATCPGS